MKTISARELLELIRNNDWHSSQHYEIHNKESIDCYLVEPSFDPETYEQLDNGEETTITNVHGSAWVISKFGGFEFIYSQDFQYTEYNEDSFTFFEPEINFTNAVIVNDDGEELDSYETEKLIDELPYEFRELCHISEIHDFDEVEEIDFNEDSNMETIVLERDNKANLKFQGELIGEASSTDNMAAGSSYSGSTGRWLELSIYKTVAGSYVGHRISRTRWEGERDKYSAVIAKDIKALTQFFGFGWLSKELYDDAKLNVSETIE